MPKTPQVKPDWETGIYIGNGVVVSESWPVIRDDGTADTLVEYPSGTFHKFDSSYRFSFENDDEFIKSIKEDLDGDPT
jgi:hypothetical protein|tara:strand:+ start:300 stop:533 length:234 start_codon:yes stop_codon:yes gene_type:complete